jgi:N4-gp56 family major capsid protein
MTDLQSQGDIVTKAKDASAYAIAKKIDYICGGLFGALSGGTGYGTDGSAITDDVIIAAVEELDEADAPDESRVWVLDPSCKADLLKIDKFVRNDYVKGGVIQTGQFGMIYNAPVLISNNLTVGSTGNVGAYYQKQALAIAIEENMLSYVVEEKLKHIKTINTETLWGVLEMRDTFGCPILTRKS